jgi:hypothetical protein|nr:hypothetical protein [Neorhizobium tomejilense]
MLAGDYIDGNAADWNSGGKDRCLCDVEATIVHRLAMKQAAFEEGLARLDRRRDVRAEFVGRRLASRRLSGSTGLGIVDADVTFLLNDEFEEIFGREPLEAFVTDTEEVVHRCLGDFFRDVRRHGAMTSPQNAGLAFKIVPARSFKTAAALVAHRSGRKTRWVPSVRTEMAFVVAGELSKITAALAGFIQAMTECGVVTRFEQAMRKPDLAGVPHIRPMLAEVGGYGARETHQVK